MGGVRFRGFTVDDVALDGYSTESHLAAILDFLDAAGVRGTFFAVPRAGETPLTKRPGYVALLREAVDRGHEVAQHGLAHDRFEIGVPPEMILRLPHEGPARAFLAAHGEELAARHTLANVRAVLAEGRAILEDVLGRPVEGFRSPALQSSPAMFEAVVREGYRYDSSTCLQEAGWDILNGLPYVPRAIDRAAFDARRVPGIVELPLTTDYAWYPSRAVFDEECRLAVHDCDACLAADIPFVTVCHVSPVQEGPDPALGFELHRRLLAHARERAAAGGCTLECLTLAEIACRWDSAAGTPRKELP